MDPLLLEALRFGLAILGGGLVAIIAQRRAFADAQKLTDRTLEAARELSLDEQRRRDHALLRALNWELQENLASLDEAGHDNLWPALRRTAWEAARGLPVSEELLVACAMAYSTGDDYGEQVARVRLILSGQMNVPNARTEMDEAMERARVAEGMFREALEALDALETRSLLSPGSDKSKPRKRPARKP
jgi:hypothetical protein